MTWAQEQLALGYLGRIHPANSMLTHELAAKLTLGIDPDETPRWG